MLVHSFLCVWGAGEVGRKEDRADGVSQLVQKLSRGSVLTPSSLMARQSG